MSHLARRAAATAVRIPTSRRIPLRSLASTSDSTHTTSSIIKPAKEPAGPYPVPTPVFPVYKDPWATPAADAPPKTKQYSDRTVKLVQGLARVMGYNSRTSTAIRETARMMKGIVESVERDRVFWYEDCGLPPTYQSFFQIHLLYVLILQPRLRALPATAALPPTPPSEIPESSEPGDPSSTTQSTSASSSILGKPSHTAYPNELIGHFFELAENQMRLVLGKGERERVVRKYMDEMGQQWRGASFSLDYALGLSVSDDISLKSKADEELASWLWRNTFNTRGLGAASSGMVEADSLEGMAMGKGVKELEMLENLSTVVKFVRREMARLDEISDADIMSAHVGSWGAIRE